MKIISKSEDPKVLKEQKKQEVFEEDGHWEIDISGPKECRKFIPNKKKK